MVEQIKSLHVASATTELVTRILALFPQARIVPREVPWSDEEISLEVYLPGTLEELVALPGVGRKTANVVLGNAFGVPGLVVDTHVLRISRRLGLTKKLTPEKVEQDLMAIIPKREWVAFGHRMIYHGRRICQARKPKCDECVMTKFCPKIGVRKPAGDDAPAEG